MEKLRDYRRRRDFTYTPEPSGEVGGERNAADTGGALYVMHKHAARNLHFDLRLAQRGVLRSWALPIQARRQPLPQWPGEGLAENEMRWS